jgi:hypothetical protein
VCIIIGVSVAIARFPSKSQNTSKKSLTNLTVAVYNLWRVWNVAKTQAGKDCKEYKGGLIIEKATGKNVPPTESEDDDLASEEESEEEEEEEMRWRWRWYVLSRERGC